MTPQKLLWGPDTCGCRFYLNWDSDEQADPKTVTPEIITVCTVHEAHKNDAVAAHAAAKEECQRKNYAIGIEALAAVPADCKEQMIDSATGEPCVDGEGNPVMVYKKGCEPSWSFNEQRELVITLPQSAKAALADVATAVDAKYEKVIIE